jgi:hypothetical protein
MYFSRPNSAESVGALQVERECTPTSQKQRPATTGHRP